MIPIYDLAIVGSGFAGSLLAMIARRTGRSVMLLEKGEHPRFAMGESTVPLGNLLLEELAIRYDLPHLLPLTKWGSWQQTYPTMPCGLKRGFSFYHHGTGNFTRENQLLVAASANDATSDTHWYRAELDSFLVRAAREVGADYFDRVDLQNISESPGEVLLQGKRFGEPVAFRARFLLDATGPRGFLHRALNLEEEGFPNYPQTEALYSHFSGVALLQNCNARENPPYPPDAAALHHVFDGGWIWVLRFNNGLTSSGVAATSKLATQLRLGEGASAWGRLLDRLPAVRQQFEKANVELPFIHSPRLPFLSRQIAGARWALLPSAAAFVDPLLSTGFPLTLFGIARFASMIEHDWETPRFGASLQEYAAQTRKEAIATAALIGALHSAMGNFPLFVSLSMLYFAAASYSETARRSNNQHLAQSFLLCEDPVFGPACARLCQKASRTKPGPETDELGAEIVRVIEPFNVAGFGDPLRRNWYPMEACQAVTSLG